jgi:hypothetical protein
MSTRAVRGVIEGEHGPVGSACVASMPWGGSQHELPLPPLGARRDAHLMRLRSDRDHRVAGSGRRQAGRARVGGWRAGLSRLWRAARTLGLGTDPLAARPTIAEPVATPVPVPSLRVDACARSHLRVCCADAMPSNSLVPLCSPNRLVRATAPSQTRSACRPRRCGAGCAASRPEPRIGATEPQVGVGIDELMDRCQSPGRRNSTRGSRR